MPRLIVTAGTRLVRGGRIAAVPLIGAPALAVNARLSAPVTSRRCTTDGCSEASTVLIRRPISSHAAAVGTMTIHSCQLEFNPMRSLASSSGVRLSVVVVCCVGLFLAAAANARAGIITGVEVQAAGDSLSHGVPASDYWTENGPAAASATEWSTSASGAASGPPGELHLTASARGYAGFAAAAAVWNDVIRISGAAPEALLLHAFVDGTISVSGGTAASAYMDVMGFGNVWFTPEITPGQFHPSADSFTMRGDLTNLNGAKGSNDDVVFNASGWLSRIEILDTGGGTHGYAESYSFLVPYDPGLGGYRFALLAHARADVHDGTASADFGHTVRLVNVTRESGDALTGPIMFDSGFSLNNTAPVPEPASGLLMLLGSGGLAWFRFAGTRRSRRPFPA